MKNRTLVAGASLALLALPAGATAKPSETDRMNAAQECRAERGSTAATREAFAVKFGTNENRKNAFGKCVSRTSVEEEQENESAKTNAAKECKTERAADPVAFSAKYGTNKNAKNAFGKCVSGKAKAKKAKADKEDAEDSEKRRNAAKQCAAERTKSGSAAFTMKYATNKNKSNAFGKCVSQTAKAQNDET